MRLTLLSCCACLVFATAACADPDPETTSGSATSGAGAGGAGGGAPRPSVVESLEDAGFAVQEGDYHVIDLASCCDPGKNCAGNNPTSPYGAFYVAPSPGQTVAESNVEADGTSNVFRLRADEALLYVGTTPPAAAYFGFTAYLTHRTYPDGQRLTPFASLGETLNSDVVAETSASAFGAPIAVLVTPDAGTEAKVRASLSAAGLAPEIVHTLTIDSTAGELGLESDSSSWSVLSRFALFEDPAAGATYLADIPGSLYRLTPGEPGAADPLPKPPARAKGTSVEDPGLVIAVDALEQAVRDAYPGVSGQSMFVTRGEPDPEACIATGTGCAGDNRDTNYPTTLPQPVFEDASEFFMILGVDHHATGKVRYASFAFYAIEHLIGITAVTDREYAGTAAAFLPAEPLADRLYAWKIARDCGSEAACTEIPVAGCPDGIAAGANGLIAFRTYLEPGTFTAPDVDTLVPSRVIRFRP